MISFEEFKKAQLKIGIVKSIDGKNARVDFGSEGILACAVNNVLVSEGETVVGVLGGGKARLLAVKSLDGSFTLLTVEKEVAAGTTAE